jgi:hypothetical protein
MLLLGGAAFCRTGGETARAAGQEPLAIKANGHARCCFMSAPFPLFLTVFYICSLPCKQQLLRYLLSKAHCHGQSTKLTASVSPAGQTASHARPVPPCCFSYCVLTVLFLVQRPMSATPTGKQVCPKLGLCHARWQQLLSGHDLYTPLVPNAASTRLVTTVLLTRPC